MSNKNEQENYNKQNKLIINDINEIKFYKRTIDNYTHEDISDKKIKKITSWRKSKKKFLSVLFLNLLTLGLLHLISKCYPKLYLKLYCNICHPKNSDFFLVEDIYGKCQLCQTQKSKKNLVKNNLKNSSLEESSKAYMCLYSSWNLQKLNINFINNNSSTQNFQYININNSQIISFIYKSKLYEYDEIKNIIIPVYLNLQGKKNNSIINIFQGGLSSDFLVNKIRERFGKNEYKLNINLIYMYFQKIEKKLLIYSILCASFEVAIQDGASTGIITTIIIIYFICRKIFLCKQLNKYNEKDYTLDGENSYRIRVKRKYLFKIKDDKKVKRKKKKKEKKKLFEDNLYKNSNNLYKNNINIGNYNDYDNNINQQEKKEEEDNYQFVEINNSDLLPGDIIYLKKGDFTPCDGIIIDGDCVVNEADLNEKNEYTYKTFLKYTNDIFNYKKNKNNILLHGTKIIKIYKKNNISDNNKQNKYITFLCINTGANTYKANQITNTIDLLERKKEYQNMYKILSGQRLLLIISVSILFFLTVLIPSILIIVKYKKNGITSLSSENSSRGPFSRGPPSNSQTSGPPSNSQTGGYSSNSQTGGPPSNSQTGGPPSNSQTGGSPSNSQTGGPPSNTQTGDSTSNSQTGGPPQNMTGGPPTNMTGGPPSGISQGIPEEAQRQIIRGFLINYFVNFFLRAIIKNFMPIYYVISSIIILLGTYRLYKIKIFSFEKMRVLFAGELNTIFMSKINILSDNHYEIKGYYPAFQASKLSNITLQEYHPEQLKDFSGIIFNYYNNIKNNKESFIGLTNISNLNKLSGKLSVWFLECLFCCNNLIKIRHDIQGNIIEKNLIDTMKWEIKVLEDENNINEVESYITENNKKDNSSEQSNADSDNNKLLYYGNDKEEKYTYNKTMDIFPQNYYKMMGKKNLGYQKFISKFKFFLSNSILKRSSTVKENKVPDKNSVNSVKKNPILKDLLNTKFSSYKLRIYKKFLTRNSLYSSAIVYNFYLKTLRFMTKGSPEKILPHCLINSLPEDICQIISDFRKGGYIIIICASKKIDIYSYNDSDEEINYMNELVFCGIITIKNNIIKESQKGIDELKKMNCEIIMNTGDDLYNSIGTGFEIGILDNKKIYAFDFDDNKKQLYVNNIYRPSFYNFEIDEKINDIKRKRNSSKYIKRNKKKDLSQSKIKNGEFINNLSRPSNYNNEEDKISPNINQNKYSNINKNRVSQNIISTNSKNSSNNNNDSNISSERINMINRSSTLKMNDQGNKEINNINLNSPNVNNNLKKSIVNSRNRKESQNMNSPKSKINKKPIKSYISLDPILVSKLKNNNSFLYNNESKSPLNPIGPLGNSFKELNHLFSYNNEIQNIELEKENYINAYFSNICYYSESLLKKIDDNCILCVSGKALQFIYNNREDMKYSNLFQILSKYSKIFYSMSSLDKSLLIDYYRELPNKKTCMIGYGSSDIDSMMTAHVGICLKKPINMNMMLFHFYLESQDLMNVKTIIEHGRVILENIFLLFISCLFCTAIIDLYMGFSFYTILDVKPEHLRIFNIFFYTLSLFGFSNSVDDKVKSNLMQNNQLFWKYIVIQFIGNIIIKTFDIWMFFYLYRKNPNIEEKQRNTILISYYAILSFNQIFTTLFGFNFIRFYRKDFYENFWFCLSLMVFFFIILIVIFFSGLGFQNVLTSYYSFENLQDKSDTFDDRNKLIMFMIVVIDLCSTILFISITQYFFNKKSKKVEYNEKESKNENEKESKSENEIEKKEI